MHCSTTLPCVASTISYSASATQWVAPPAPILSTELLAFLFLSTSSKPHVCPQCHAFPCSGSDGCLLCFICVAAPTSSPLVYVRIMSPPIWPCLSSYPQAMETMRTFEKSVEQKPRKRGGNMLEKGGGRKERRAVKHWINRKNGGKKATSLEGLEKQSEN